ncbi:threonine synthase [Brevibacillus dissolubilis]|uniref:threonine synthase n=1 Tax=Brevibacillus dissolubilis TaxID=1844116 RepID=UPI00111725C8|nr:threonine synthase [Brevibacillus dissolubilis]
MFSYVSHLECPKCGLTHPVDQQINLCTCGSPLLVRYHLNDLKKAWQKSSLTTRPATLWRYHELLPVVDEANIVTLGEGMTPLLPTTRLARELGVREMYVKDEGIIPTGSFKARGAAVGVSKAKELGITDIAMPTNGNAGAAWSTYAARAGMRSTIVMPKAAPFLTRGECAMAGANLYLVNGLISDAGKIVGRAVQKHGWFDASTLKEPYRIEGKKTMGLEIAEQLGWKLPDVILYPTGGGVGIIGIYKALRELQELGWVEGPLPRLVAVQSKGCAPIVRAWQEGKRESVFWEHSETVAFGINVPKALGDFLVLEAVYETDGCAIAVDDRDIIMEQKHLASTEGLFICPEGAATVAAARELRKIGWIKESDTIVVLNTGIGIKYPETIDMHVKTLQPDSDLPETYIG